MRKLLNYLVTGYKVRGTSFLWDSCT